MKILFATTSLATILFCVIFQPKDDPAEFKHRLEYDYQRRFEAPKPHEYRVWNSKTGHFRTNAKFVKIDGTDVIIEKAPRRIAVPVESLSIGDHEFIDEVQTKSKIKSFTVEQKGFLFSTSWHPSQRLTWEYPKNKPEARQKTKALFNSKIGGKYSGGAYLTFSDNGFDFNRGEKAWIDPFPYDKELWYKRVIILSPGHIAVLNKDGIWIVYRSLNLVD